MPPESDEEDPTVLAALGPTSDVSDDGSDLHAPTRPSFPTPVPSPLAAGFDEVPPAEARHVHKERTQKLVEDAEAPTVMRRLEPVEVVVRVPMPRPGERDPREVANLAAKSALAGLLVGLCILVPITLMVIWSTY